MAAKKGRFAVVDCEDAAKWVGHHHIWIASLAAERELWEHYKAFDGELPDLSGEGKPFTGIVLTGSHHDAHSDALPWIGKLAAFLKDVVTKHPNIKVFGGCFGCQVLARALGGKVGRNPSGQFVVGAEEITPTDQMQTRPDFVFAVANSRAKGGKGLGSSMRLVVSHADQVLELPPGAEALASSASTPVEMWSYGDNVLAMQSHPELTPAICRSRILTAVLEKGVIDAAQEEAAWKSMQSPLAAPLVLDMVRHFLRGAPPRTAAPKTALDAVEEFFGPAALLGHPASLSASPPAVKPANTARRLPQLMDEMFHNVTAAITGELKATANEYELLADMNNIASEKYKDMGDFAEGMLVFVERMQEKEDAFKPYVEQIDAIDTQVAELESVVNKLDLYTRRMEAQFRVLTQAAPVVPTP